MAVNFYSGFQASRKLRPAGQQPVGPALNAGSVLKPSRREFAQENEKCDEIAFAGAVRADGRVQGLQRQVFKPLNGLESSNGDSVYGRFGVHGFSQP